MQFSESESHSFLRQYLLKWYGENKRDLPWRKSNDPYKIWLSEVILQQTRVEQGLPYYVKIVEQFPKIELLANSHVDDLLSLWQGLGYYSRARNLHEGAKQISRDYEGKFPNEYTELLKIKGIGTYTAAAIASIAFNKVNAVVDGNVYRVLARYYGIATDISSNTGKKEFQEIANKVIDKDSPGDYNQAIMEFGALFCTPKKPLCMTCGLKDNCIAFKNSTQLMLPVKAKKNAVKTVHIHYAFIKNGQHEIAFFQRINKGIWQGLFEPYLGKENNAKTLQRSDWESILSLTISSARKIDKRNHLLSHRKLIIHSYLIDIEEQHDLFAVLKNVKWVGKEHFDDLPTPIVISNILNEQEIW